MLKQSTGRNQRVKGFKVKHAVQISLLLAICIWLVYQLNHSHGKNALEVSSAEKMLGEVQHEHGVVLKLGRRGLHPRGEETPVDVGRHMEKEEEYQEEVDETKAEESEEGKGSGDEVDGHDQEKSEEESEEVEDLIDEDDTEREEEEEQSEEKENDLEDQVQSKDKRYGQDSQEAREDQYKGDDASSAVKQNIYTISSKLEIGSLRRVKEEEVGSAENIDLEKDNTSEKPKREQWFSFWNRDAT